MRIRNARLLGAAMLVALTAAVAVAGTFKSTEDPQMVGLNGWTTDPVFTVGETAFNYTPIGILDGLGAFKYKKRVRIYVNHEVSPNLGYAYTLLDGLNNPFDIKGARVSYVDFDPKTREICGMGPAYDRVYDRTGSIASSPGDINELSAGDPGADINGFNRLCSAQDLQRGKYGFVNDIFLTNEETSVAYGHPHGGSYWALDVAKGDLWAVPELGRGTWESASAVDLGRYNRRYVGLLLGDDFQAAPLYLYIGKKIPGGNFLERNGLATGQLFVWVAQDGSRDPEDWNGTCSKRRGRFVAIDARDPANAGNAGYDAFGYKDDATLRAEATGDAPAGLEAFAFSRPEDLAINPRNGKQVVMASTGRPSLFPSDSWGTTYVINMKIRKIDARLWRSQLGATLTILFDGDDAGGGSFAGPDYGLRSPDNIEWARDGYIYVNEDRSIAGFGQTSGEEASIWRLNPKRCGWGKRIAQMNRLAALPGGQTDNDPNDIGDWESSGVLDVTKYFKTKKGETLLIADVQAHSVRDGTIASLDLVQGGQIFFLSRQKASSKKDKSRCDD